MIKDSQSSGKLSSVSSFLNNCRTKSGKRMFHYNLLNPTNNIEWLQQEYEMNTFYRNNYYHKTERNILDGVMIWN